MSDIARRNEALMELAGQANAALESPANPPGSAAHTASPHLDKAGTCECDCPSCTVDAPEVAADAIRCICPDCDPAVCGLHGERGSYAH